MHTEFRQLEPMSVARVRTLSGSRIEPAIEDDWTDEDKLRWHAAVVAADTGLAIRLNVQPRRNRWSPHLYGYNVGSTSGAACDYDAMWIYLNGVAVGARAQQQKTATEEAS